ncbi:hypothetical protein AX768_13425 [Burkholderia sp. PAMC 28687]|uniref:hypothetical protein n=1 Tax=Burkholderia sp. PAMC 28687 TaxID=1795874 RepID=UPI000783D1BB|nr:hypothetical protein [Burkholderia sp. PAMC 28687]AMM14950.1 hypothetical protein AX768_13425 [Burkholderia sp. PAMC 28687]
MEHFEISDALAATHDAATPEQRAATRDDLKAAAASLAFAARRIIRFSPARGDDVLVARLLEMQDFILKSAILFDFASAAEAQESQVFAGIDMSTTPAQAIAIDRSADA